MGRIAELDKVRGLNTPDRDRLIIWCKKDTMGDDIRLILSHRPYVVTNRSIDFPTTQGFIKGENGRKGNKMFLAQISRHFKF